MKPLVPPWIALDLMYCGFAGQYGPLEAKRLLWDAMLSGSVP